MPRDLYDFGWMWEEEDVVVMDDQEEVLPDEVIVIDEDVLPTEEIISEDITDTPSEASDVESNIDDETAALDKELAELEELLSGSSSNPEGMAETNEEVSTKLQDSIKAMQSMTKKINDLELEKAERTKFWENAWLSPELIIIKANYDKAMKGDEGAINKIRELIATDLWLEVTNQKQVSVSSAISSWADVNIADDEGGSTSFFM